MLVVLTPETRISPVTGPTLDRGGIWCRATGLDWSIGKAPADVGELTERLTKPETGRIQCPDVLQALIHPWSQHPLRGCIFAKDPDHNKSAM